MDDGDGDGEGQKEHNVNSNETQKGSGGKTKVQRRGGLFRRARSKEQAGDADSKELDRKESMLTRIENWLPDDELVSVKKW